MNTLELLDIISNGETSRVQFKEKIDSPDSLAAEMVAMSNTRGGLILVGIRDRTGDIIGLSNGELQKYNGQITFNIGNIANDKVIPSIFVTTEVVSIADNGNEKKILIIEVKEGTDKPYKDKNSIAWIKQGADKRKITDNNELLRLFQESGNLTADEMEVANTTFGNDSAGSAYRGSNDITGTIPNLFKEGIAFLNNYLKHTQQGQNFNSTGILEISKVALEEVLQNALIHRDYFKNSPIKIMIFDNRVEIISPGVLPNSLTVENIKAGNSVIRNNLLASYCAKVMPYRGLGTGIKRAIKEQPNIEFVNDTDGEQFIVRIPRPETED